MINEVSNSSRGFVKRLIGFSSASWISAAISFISTPIITRLFLPQEVGKINLFTTFMVLFQTVSILGLDQAFMRFYNEPPFKINKKTLLGLCMVFSFSMSMICALIVLIFYKEVSTEITGDVKISITFFLIISIFSSVSLRMTSIASRMEQKVFSYTVQTICITFIEKVLFAFIAFFQPEHIAAIATMSTGYFVVAVLFLFIKRKSIEIDLKIPKESINMILRFALPYLPVLLLSWLNNSIPQFVLKRFVDYGAIGIYTNAVSIANILTIIQTGFNVYWAPFAYENYKTHKYRLTKVHKCISFLLISFAVLIIIGQDFIYLLLGEKYRISRMFFPFLILSPICNSIADTTGIGIMLSKKSYKNIYTFSGSVITNIFLSLILVPYLGIMGGALAAGTASVVMLSIRTYIGSKYYRLSDNYNYLYMSIILLYVIAFLNYFLSSQLILRELFIVICLLFIIFIYRKEFRYLFNFVSMEIINLIRRK